MWKLGKACVIIHINGKNAERFLNAMRGEGVPLSHITRVTKDELRATMPAKDFRRVRRHAGRLHCRVHIEDRGGAAFIALRLYRRRMLWIGGLAGLALLIAASTRLWHIRVEGNVRVSETTIRRKLAQHGLVVGAARPSGAFDALADAIAAYDERIAWVGLDLNGVCLTVRIKEAAYDMLALDPSVPCDIVAVKDGVVTEISALDGAAAFSVGEQVHAGDVLISGIIELADIPEPMFVHARGAVKASVYYFSEYAQGLSATERAPTGATSAYRRVSLCGLTLYESKAPYADFDVAECRETTWRLPLLPVTVWEGEYSEMAMQACELTPAEAAELALVEAERLALLRVPSDAAIVDKINDWTLRDGVVIATCAIVTKESIGLTKEIRN